MGLKKHVAWCNTWHFINDKCALKLDSPLFRELYKAIHFLINHMSGRNYQGSHQVLGDDREFKS